MILETLPEVQSLSDEKKMILAQELLDELNAPRLTSQQDTAILDVLNARYQAYRNDPSTASSWTEAKDRLRQRGSL